MSAFPPRFELIRALGAGATGTVYEVRDRETGNRLALKLFDGTSPDEVASVKAEFRVVRDVRHPNLASIGELFEYRGRWSYTMELVDGLDLGTWFERVRNEPEVLVRFCLVMRGLAETLVLLHRASLLHLDIKPQNVLVTEDDRVVLIDYGLIAGRGLAIDGRPLGTLPYTAPERVAGRSSAASDWYAFGALLYQFFAGRPPFSGDPSVMQAAKLRGPAPLAHAPAAMASLALALLDPDPARRPDGKAVATRLGAVLGATAFQTRAAGPVSPALLDELDEAYQDDTRCVVLAGAAGTSKHAAVAAWKAMHPNMLHARARTRERTAFHGFEGLVDVIVERVSRYAFVDQARVLPREIHHAARMFPALARLDIVQRGAGLAHDDTVATPAAVARAIATILCALSAEEPLYLVLENLQRWDRDALVMLEHLLDAIDFTRVFLLITLQPEAAHTARLTTILSDLGIVHRWITLERDETRTSNLGGVEALSPIARRLLDVVAVSVVPLPIEVALGVAQVPSDQRDDAVAELVYAGLVYPEDEALAAYDADGIARRVVPQMIPVWRERIAQALDAHDASPYLRARAHAVTARPAEAIAIARTAAERALARGAAELATELYELAIECGDRMAATYEQLAVAARLSGRISVVARAALALATANPGALSYRRAAGVALLQSGELEPGLDILRETDGLHVPSSRWSTLLRMGWTRLWRRRRVSTRAVADDAQLERIDTLWAVTGALGIVDTLRGALVQAYHLRAALRSGDARRAARALASEGAFRAASLPTRRVVETWFAEARSLAVPVGDPHTHGWILGCRSLVALMYGEWHDVVDLATSSRELLAQVPATHWEQTTIGHGLLAAQFFLGDLAGLEHTSRELLASSRQRDDHFGEVAARVATIPALLARGDFEVADDQLTAARAIWPRGNVQSAFIALHRAQLCIARGEGSQGLTIIDAAWADLAARFLTRVPLVRIPLREVAARCALVAARTDPRARARARREIGKLLREPVAWGRALGVLQQSGLAALDGPAISERKHAAEVCEALSMPMHAAFARTRAGLEVGAAPWQAFAAIHAP